MTKKKVKVKKVKENPWQYFTKNFVIREENLFSDDAVILPVVVCQNKDTGELKFFNRSFLEKIGIENIKI